MFITFIVKVKVAGEKGRGIFPLLPPLYGRTVGLQSNENRLVYLLFIALES